MLSHKPPAVITGRFKLLVSAVSALLILAGGYLAAEWRAGIADRELRKGLLSQAVDLALAINPEHVKALSFSVEDKELPEFTRLTHQLRAFQTVTRYRGTWTLGLRGDSLVIGPKSYMENDPLASPPGTVYEQPTKEIRDIFRNGRPFVQGPYTDEYGTFVSSFAPVLHRGTGDVLMVVGVDVEAGDWRWALMKARLVSIGCMMIPIAILFAGILILRHRSRLPLNNRGRLRYAEVWIVALSGLAVTGIAALVLHDSETRSRQASFRHLAVARAALVADAFWDLRDHKLDSIARFFESSHYVEREEFQLFTAPMARRLDIDAFAWIRPIPEVEKDRWMRHARAERSTGFKIWQRGADGRKIYPAERDVYYPVWYIEPEEGNREVLGFDVGSEPVRRTALETAIESRLPTAAGPVTLVHKKEKDPGLIIFQPVFYRERHEGLLRGVAVAAIRFPPFLRSTLTTGLLDDDPTLVGLYELKPEEPPRYLASCIRHCPDRQNDFHGENAKHMGHRDNSFSFPIFTFGKAYEMVVRPTDALLAANSARDGLAAVLAGTTFTAFLAFFVASLLRRREELESLVQARTAELHELNMELEQRVSDRTKELKKAKTEAEQANRAKSDFLSAMSHEIRTPMNGVIGMIDVLEQSSLEQNQMEMVEVMRESALHLLSIIDDILDFSKIEAGELEAESAPMNIEKVVEGLCDMLDRIALKSGVDLTLFVDPAIPAKAIGDATRLRQVLVNLINNAVKFSCCRAGRGRVSVRVVPVESGTGGFVEFIVSDNGIGMDEATVSRLFQPFFSHGDAPSTHRYGGTGLGLPISQRLVELMEGEITVQSSPGAGSVFTVRLPLRPAEAATPERLYNLEGVSCLVVGGEESTAGDLAAYLTFEDVPVKLVSDIKNARDRIYSMEPGLWVCIIENGSGREQVEEFKPALSAREGLDMRFVVIGKGRRRRPRKEAGGEIVTLDVNVMHRTRFLKAVAVAAGRADLEEGKEQAGGDRTAATPLSLDEARRLKRLVLVAEDNETNRKVVRQQLELLGYAADVTPNGREALEKLKEEKYDLLLTDIHMPYMDGYELATSVRAMEGDSDSIPIIAFTANVTEGEIDRCMAAGMDDYLGKPVRLGRLKNMLEKWLPGASEKWKEEETGPVDLNVLAGFVGNDPEIVRDFLRDFRKSAADAAGALHLAILNRDAESAGNTAHKLKSAARAVGATALGDLCSQLELAGKNQDSKVLDALIIQFDVEMARVDKFIESMLGKDMGKNSI